MVATIAAHQPLSPNYSHNHTLSITTTTSSTTTTATTQSQQPPPQPQPQQLLLQYLQHAPASTNRCNFDIFERAVLTSVSLAAIRQWTILYVLQ